MFFFLLFLFFSSPSWSTEDIDSNERYWSKENDAAPLLQLNIQEEGACVVDLTTKPGVTENKSLPQEMWWMIAAYTGDEFYKLVYLSKGINGHIKCLIPHFVLPKRPSVQTILTCLDIMEKCEKAYTTLKNIGPETPYFPAYKSQVNKLTDAEFYVKYSPVFWWNNGINRLEALRKGHNLDTPKNQYNSLFTACSSFARDPLVVFLNTAAIGGLTIAGLCHIYSIWSDHNLSHLKYLHDYLAALNHTTSEDFPQSLKIVYNYTKRYSRPAEEGEPAYLPAAIGLDETKLYDCYNKCEGWRTNELIKFYYYDGTYYDGILLPINMCENPNRTSPAYINMLHNFSSSIFRVCGQKFRDLWTPWIEENLGNFTTSLRNTINENYFNNYYTSTIYPGIEKIKNQNSFIHVFHSRQQDFVGPDNTTAAPYCFLSTKLYTYDPLCIAQKMPSVKQLPFPMLVVAAWGGTASFIWMGFFIMMMLGWFL